MDSAPAIYGPTTTARTWVLRFGCALLAAILIFSAGSSKTLSYTWTLPVLLHDHPDGSVSASGPVEPLPSDLAAALRITLTSDDIGQWMTVGRTFTAREETVKLSPKRSNIYTPTLRPLIGEVIARPVPPDGLSTLTADAETAFREALALYQAQQDEKTTFRAPPAREWMRLTAVLLILAAISSIALSFFRARLYRSRGRERLALDQCPHCGAAMPLTDDPKCPSCGTDHIQWAIALNVNPNHAVANSEGPPPPAMPNLPPPPDQPA